jgi:hypothetical protein
MRSLIRSSVLPLALGLLPACSAILPPDTKDDGVERCDNVGDCTESEDSRFDVECVFGEGQDEDSQKICAPTFATVDCDPEEYSENTGFREKWDEAVAASGVYLPCDEDKKGERGCKPKPGNECNDPGHSVNEHGVCDDLDAEYAAVEAEASREGFDGPAIPTRSRELEVASSCT